MTIAEGTDTFVHAGLNVDDTTQATVDAFVQQQTVRHLP
jgi:hypothetical protein